MIPGRKVSGRSGSLLRGTRDEGFTVLELLLVVALVTVLSGMVLGLGRYARNSGRVARASAELASLAAALESYRSVHGDYPRTKLSPELLQSLVGRRGPTGELISARSMIEIARFSLVADSDPFLSATTELLDPWGAPYGYAYKSELPWSNPGFVLYSAGPDGRVAEALLPGGFPDYSGPDNNDNLWANPP